MDVAEHRVRCPESTAQPDCGPDADVSDRVQQALIWGGYGDDRLSSVQLSDPLEGLGNDSWHTFAIDWSPAKVRFFYDGVETWSVSGPISRRAEYLILSSEVAAFAGDAPSDGYGSRATSTTNVQVDWVRVWSHTKDAVAPVSIGAPRVSGAAKVGGTLACSPGAWTGDPAPALTFAWLSDGVALDGATSASYGVRAGDRGHALGCRVTASNPAGVVSAQSNALAIPLPSQKVAPKVAVIMACPICRATVVSATALTTIRVPRVGRTPARTYTPATRATTSATGKAVKIALRLVRRMRGAIIRALLAHKPIVAVLDVRLKDSAGAAGTVTWRVALRL